MRRSSRCECSTSVSPLPSGKPRSNAPSSPDYPSSSLARLQMRNDLTSLQMRSDHAHSRVHPQKSRKSGRIEKSAVVPRVVDSATRERKNEGDV